VIANQTTAFCFIALGNSSPNGRRLSAKGARMRKFFSHGEK